jgi:hypothetical protein
VAVAGAGAVLVGYFTGIGVWAGIGISLLSFIVCFFQIYALIPLNEALEDRDSIFSRFVMPSLFSLLGLALGGGLGWWLQQSGVSLP